MSEPVAWAIYAVQDDELIDVLPWKPEREEDGLRYEPLYHRIPEEKKLRLKVVVGNTHFHPGVSASSAFDALVRSLEQGEISEEQVKQTLASLGMEYKTPQQLGRYSCAHCGSEAWKNDASLNLDKPIQPSIYPEEHDGRKLRHCSCGFPAVPCARSQTDCVMYEPTRPSHG